MEHIRKNPAVLAWTAVGAFVVAWDCLADQTMSAYADRLLENPKTRVIPWAIGGIVAGHVLNVIPRQLDVIQQAGDYVARKLL